MKIHPPRPDIPPEEPFKNCAFERRKFAQSLTTLVKDTEEPVVICVDAAWGEGKTTFTRMWKADLLKQGYRSIYYDAFADDFVSDPFVAFCAEIQAFLDDERTQHRPIATHAKSFFEKATNAVRVFLPKGAAAAAKSVVMASAPAASGAEPLAEAAAASVEAMAEGMLERRHSEKRALRDFATELESVGQAIRKAQGFPLLVMVDELDRCRPDYALTLVERIKHLFSVKNVTFVLMASLTQLESQVRAVYGKDVDARNYLLKFFTITAKLPKDVRDPDYNHYARYAGILDGHFNLNITRRAGNDLVRLFRRYSFSLREMESFFTHLNLVIRNIPTHHPWVFEVALLLAVVRMKIPALFLDFSLDRLSYDDFIAHAAMSDVDVSNDSRDRDRYLLRSMRYLLMTDSEFASLPSDDPIAKYAQTGGFDHNRRREIIPQVCEVLGRFDYVG